MLITQPSELEQFSAQHRVWQGMPGIVKTKGGRIFVSFYSGNVTEDYGNYSVVIKSDDGKNFSEPIVAAKKDGQFRCFDCALWIDPLDRLWFFWSVMPGEETYASICENPDDDTLCFGKEFYVGRGVMLNKPTVLSSGEWLFPIAFWRPEHCAELYKQMRLPGLKEDDVSGSFVYKTSDNGKTFEKMGGIEIPGISFYEHQVVELQDGTLMMLIRTLYGIGVSYSYDRGKTWSEAKDSGLGGPSSRFFISRLRSGRILLINHYHFTERNNMTALLSEDDGKTFPYSLLLDERSLVSYPDACEGDDGYIYITYDRERGSFTSSLEEAYGQAREILTARISEDDIKSSTLHDGSYIKNIASKLGKLTDADVEILRPKYCKNSQ